MTEIEKVMGGVIVSLGGSLGLVGRWLLVQINVAQTANLRHEERMNDLVNGDRAEVKQIMGQVARNTEQIAEALKHVRRCPYDEKEVRDR